MMKILKIVTDATCRRKGPALKGKSIGVAQFYDESGSLLETKEFILGEMIPYAAECETVLRALDIASGITRGSIEIWTDCETLVRHMNGDYRLKADLSKKYFDQLSTLGLRFTNVDYYHHDRDTLLGQSAHQAASNTFTNVHSKIQSSAVAK